MAKAKSTGEVYQLKVTLQGTRPPVWRRLQVKDGSLAELHEIIQVAMGWEFGHLFAFEIGGEQYSDPGMIEDLDMADGRRVKLSQVVAGGHKKFGYVYDFGDNWDHTILVEKTVPAEPGVKYPRCVAGKRACPPEDCGGVWGYAHLLEVLADPNNEEHEEMVEWLGDEFDPEAFDAEAVNEELLGEG